MPESGMASATNAIAPEEVYIEVPSRIIMDAGKAIMGVSGVAPLIRSLRSAYRRADTFIELLLFLLHERLVRGQTVAFTGRQILSFEGPKTTRICKGLDGRSFLKLFKNSIGTLA